MDIDAQCPGLTPTGAQDDVSHLVLMAPPGIVSIVDVT